MEGQVSWVIELAVKPGELEAFKALMEEMVAGTNAEPTTLGYEWFISDDGGTDRKSTRLNSSHRL